MDCRPWSRGRIFKKPSYRRMPIMRSLGSTSACGPSSSGRPTLSLTSPDRRVTSFFVSGLYPSTQKRCLSTSTKIRSRSSFGGRYTLSAAMRPFSGASITLASPSGPPSPSHSACTSMQLLLAITKFCAELLVKLHTRAARTAVAGCALAM